MAKSGLTKHRLNTILSAGKIESVKKLTKEKDDYEGFKMSFYGKLEDISVVKEGLKFTPKKDKYYVVFQGGFKVIMDSWFIEDICKKV